MAEFVLPAAALAGLAAFKAGVVAVGALGALFGGRRGGRRRVFGHRRGREAGQDLPGMVNSLLEMVWEGDASRCSEKLTCVLAATPEDSLHLSGKEILDMVRVINAKEAKTCLRTGGT